MYTKQVDIILPAYNEANRISDTILSIQSSSYKNWRLIIVDDCSTDETVKIIEKHIELDSRIKLVKNTSNIHIALSLNKALKHCRNEYVFRIDSGDLFTPDRIELQLTYMIQENLDMSVGNFKKINESGNVVYQSSLKLDSKKLKRASKFANIAIHPSFCFKLDLAKKVFGYKCFVPAEDYDFICRVFLMGFSIGVVKSTLIHCDGSFVGISKSNQVWQKGLALLIAKKFRRGEELTMLEYDQLKQKLEKLSSFSCKIIFIKYKVSRLIASLVCYQRFGRSL